MPRKHDVAFKYDVLVDLSILHWRCYTSQRREFSTCLCSFNTPLEMPERMRAVRPFFFSVMTFNTPLEMPPRGEEAQSGGSAGDFQYSIGDAGFS